MFLDVCFTFDIFITLNTALQIEGEKGLITDRKSIFQTYLKGMLIMDILAVIPFYLVTESQGGRSSAFIRFIRLAKLIRIFRASKILKVLKHISNS